MACVSPYAIGNAVFSCYRCKPCLIAMSEYWRDRQDLEYTHTRDVLGRGSSFVTLTYQDEQLPTAIRVREDGKLLCVARHGAALVQADDDGWAVEERRHNLGLLVRADLRRFIRTINQRLVRHGGTKLRYSGVGEYGEKFGRPHFHVMLFGYAPADRIGAFTFAEHVHAAWGRGKTDVGPVLKGASHYISGYISGPKAVAGHPSLEGRPPEFCSRSPSLGGGAVDLYADAFAATPYASSVEEGVSKPITMRTEFREVWLRKSLLRRFFTRLGYADAADARSVHEVQVLAPAEAFVLDRSHELVEVKRTILARANMAKAWTGTRVLADRRDLMIEEADGPRDLGGNPNILETTADYHRELHGERISQLVAANAAYAAQSLQRRVF